MNVSYEAIKSFMEAYFEDYSSFAQDEETMPQMNRYWTEDFIPTAYLKLKDGVYPQIHDNRTDWQQFLIEGHLKVLETLEPKELMIDVNAMKATALINVKKFSRETKEPLCDLDGIGYYKLVVDEEGALKIKSLDFFCGDPGKLTSLYEI